MGEVCHDMAGLLLFWLKENIPYLMVRVKNMAYKGNVFIAAFIVKKTVDCT